MLHHASKTSQREWRGRGIVRQLIQVALYGIWCSQPFDESAFPCGEREGGWMQVGGQGWILSLRAKMDPISCG